MARKTARRAASLAAPELPYDDVQQIKYALWSGDQDRRLRAAPPGKRLVAEGDSWFDYLPGIDILDHLKAIHGYEIYKVARAGDTVENMAFGTEIGDNYSRRLPQLTETLAAVKKHKPKVVLLSGGGNDFAGDELLAYLNHAGSGLPALRRDYAAFMTATSFRSAYEHILGQIWKVDPSVHVVAHGYARPIPDGRCVRIVGIRFSGPWLRPSLCRKGHVDAAAARLLVGEIVDLFNEMLASLAAAHPRFHYLDLRPSIGDGDWANELHLTNAAYRRVSDRFHAEIRKYA
jgi:lysophospholipase L1-like esterase